MSFAMRPAAGEFDQRVTLQRRTATLDARGQDVGAWQDVATVWGKWRPANGRDYAAADQAQATLDGVLHIRYRADVQPDWRVVWRGEPFELIGIPFDVDGARHTLELRLTKGVRDGR